MKSICTLILVLMAGTAYGQNNLPACQGIDSIKWNNCSGIQTFATGEKIMGEFHFGKLNGYGTRIWANGEKYVGVFSDGKLNGHGSYTHPNGDKYVGEFKDGLRDGQGTYTFSNGDQYVGEYKDHKYNGQGTFFRADGRIGLGEWAKGNPNGRFIEYRADKTLERSGIYKDDKLVTSQYIDPNSFTRIALGDASKNISDNRQSDNSITLDVAKIKCEELGFKPETEGFGKCVLQLTK